MFWPGHFWPGVSFLCLGYFQVPLGSQAPNNLFTPCISPQTAPPTP
jgi:hypothetical protein